MNSANSTSSSSIDFFSCFRPRMVRVNYLATTMKSCVDIAICIVLPWSGGINPRASKEKSLLLWAFLTWKHEGRGRQSILVTTERRKETEDGRELYLIYEGILWVWIQKGTFIGNSIEKTFFGNTKMTVDIGFRFGKFIFKNENFARFSEIIKKFKFKN